MPSRTVLDLSRWRSWFRAYLPYEFPAITVELAVFLFVVYAAHAPTGNPVYLQIYRLWRKTVAVGGVAGIVLCACIVSG
jgi:cytochrome d ubiquinol oxidase subunit I